MALAAHYGAVTGVHNTSGRVGRDRLPTGLCGRDRRALHRLVDLVRNTALLPPAPSGDLERPETALEMVGQRHQHLVLSVRQRRLGRQAPWRAPR
jgi:hypothetical protein